MNKNFFHNNFDLVRLFAASQVVLCNHYPSHFGLDFKFYLFSAFPGVPVFFFVSGFLISASYEKNSKLRNYFKNRVLRIFPALYVCLLLSIALVFLSGYEITAGIKGFSVWVLTQLIFPVYNPEFFRGYGVGVVNGSLWTIPVELQFYALLPLLYVIFKFKASNWMRIVGLIVVFYLITLAINEFLFPHFGLTWENMSVKLISVSIIPYLYIFLIGVLFQRYFDFFYKLLRGKFFIILMSYLAIFTLLHFLNLNNIYFQLFTYSMMGMCTFSFAYSFDGLSEKLLKNNDISYGVYIYHMPLCNFALMALVPLMGSVYACLISIVATYAIATLSWKFIEAPALKLKKKQLFARKI